MSNLSDRVTREALSLPADYRLALIERLLESLNLPTRAEVDTAWAEEAEKRVREVDEGRVKPVSGPTVFKRLRKKLKG